MRERGGEGCRNDRGNLIVAICAGAYCLLARAATQATKLLTQQNCRANPSTGKEGRRTERHAAAARPYFADIFSSSSRYDFHTAASVCVPWPAVLLLSGMTTAFPFGTRVISRSSTPSSPGLTRSSYEFTA